MNTNTDSNTVFKDFNDIYNIEEKNKLLLSVTHINTLVVEFNEESSIDNLEIPAIIYNGSESDIPDIFERLNTGAVVLSK